GKEPSATGMRYSPVSPPICIGNFAGATLEFHALRTRGHDHMIASFFDTTKTNEFADWIVAEVKRAAPPDSAPRKKKHVIRAQEMDENITRRVVEFTRTTRLNIYKK